MKHAITWTRSSHFRNHFSRFSLLICTSLILASCSKESEPTTVASDKPTHIELIAADLSPVQFGALQRKSPFTGTLRAIQQSNVQSQVSAQVLNVFVEVGQQVHQGQVLTELNSQDQSARLAQSHANLASSKAQAELARSLMERKKRLYDQGFIAKVEYEQSRVDYQAQLENVKAQQANVDISNKAIQDSKIISPIQGSIVGRNIEPGQTVSPGQTLFQIVDTQKIELQGSISANEQSELSIGKQIQFNIQGNDEVYQATITRIAPIANSANRQIDFYARPLNAISSISIGAYVKGEIISPAHAKGYLVPLNSIQNLDEKPYVWVIRNQILVKQAIDIIAQDYASNTAVVNGLQTNDQVSRVAFSDEDQKKTVKVSAQ